MTTPPDLADRLAALWDHLGLEAAHVGLQMSGDMEGFARRHPGRIAGLLFCEATGIDAAAFAAIAPRMTILAGDGGISARAAAMVAPLLPGCRQVTLAGYAKPVWADSVADRTAEVVDALLALPGTPSVPSAAVPRQGSVAGIPYRIEGAGPALVLAPMFLSAAQWDAALPALARHRSVVLLGGRHLGGVALLEDRATSPSYRGMVKTLLDVIAPASGESLLELGCGTGALVRLAARHLGGACPITAADLNRFLLREATALTDEEAIGGITFAEADAERLPFPDAAFDHAFSVDRAGGMRRRPGAARAASRGAPGRARRRDRARGRHAAPLPPRPAAAACGEGGEPAALGRARRHRRCQPLSPHARGGLRAGRLLSDAGRLSRPGRRLLPLHRERRAGAARPGGDGGLERSAGQCGGSGDALRHPPAPLRRRAEARLTGTYFFSGISTAPPAVFQAVKPPPTCATFSRPISCTVLVASAERQAEAQ